MNKQISYLNKYDLKCHWRSQKSLNFSVKYVFYVKKKLIYFIFYLSCNFYNIRRLWNLCFYDFINSVKYWSCCKQGKIQSIKISDLKAFGEIILQAKKSTQKYSPNFKVCFPWGWSWKKVFPSWLCSSLQTRVFPQSSRSEI